ncbi:polysaccharide deacetylase family protein [Gramella sp. GC03-9]|uniref:Polysaccharide deacetylase family protein n=1 Tax=Christiangramia oceanisediminis TaxID=2920386 RepID=A0A9X2I3K4_9FLAO|nr:polysaccharide deacetylase family protein [Gramella oceanisediminis]MCP9198707.1 polysaccharide deacetylase family protein [Gramella oceanisediminis]
MKLFLAKYPGLLKRLYPGRITRLPEKEAIYLTFDDGPVPEVSPWVMEELKKYDAKATFFCIGDNVKKHPEIFKLLLKEGHAVGNHTFNHLNGWKTSLDAFIKNTLKAEEAMSDIESFRQESKNNSGKNSIEHTTPNYPLFRPPYGRIKNSQAGKLNLLGYKILMWDVLSGDYDQEISAENCYRNVIKNATAGSTIVFHDSLKAEKNLREVLPKVLVYYAKKGFKFRSLKDIL